MSELQANRALTDTAKMRRIDVIRHESTRIEEAVRMSVADRRYRQHEARVMHAAGWPWTV